MPAPDHQRLRSEAESFLGDKTYLHTGDLIESALAHPDQYPEVHFLATTRTRRGQKQHINRAILKLKPGFRQWNRPSHGINWAVYVRDDHA